MKISKRHIFHFAIALIVAIFLSTFQLPYYIYKPGRADSLDAIVNVEDGYESEGSMHLLTVSGVHATPIQYFLAKILPFHEILPIETVRRGLSDEEYLQRQLHMMESSQQSSTVVAYEAAKAHIKIEYNGVYVVSVSENMPAEGVLNIGDIIKKIDGKQINESDDLISHIEGMKAGDTITLEYEREGNILTDTLELVTFEEAKNKVGIGISLVTNRTVEVEPKVHFSSGKIGGPSAGLMFALDIYDQLTEEDLTKGLLVAGTGEIDYEGNVRSIGGVDKKVVAAHKSGCDIFFVPNEHGAENSNYVVAKKTAEQIKTDMVIVPVDTFEEALSYLENLE